MNDLQNNDGWGRREFLPVTGAGSLGLLAFGWPAWSMAATVDDVLELKLRGAGLTFRGGQPQVVVALTNTEASPLTLTPQVAAVVTKATRQTPAGPASASTFSGAIGAVSSFSWTVSLRASVSLADKEWIEAWKAKKGERHWEIPITEYVSVAQVPGKMARFIRLQTQPAKPAPLLLKQVEVWGK